jgi:hypothetical protein
MVGGLNHGKSSLPGHALEFPVPFGVLLSVDYNGAADLAHIEVQLSYLGGVVFGHA